MSVPKLSSAGVLEVIFVYLVDVEKVLVLPFFSTEFELNSLSSSSPSSSFEFTPFFLSIDPMSFFSTKALTVSYEMFSTLKISVTRFVLSFNIASKGAQNQPYSCQIDEPQVQ